MWTTIKTTFNAFTRFQQALLIGALLLIMLFFSGLASSFIWHWKDKRFEAKEQKLQQQVQELTAEREKAVARAELLEKQAAELEAKTKVQQAIIDAAGQRAAEVQRKADDEQQKIDSEVAASDVDVSFDERARRISERLQRLYPKAKH